jgi:hypothetical protein
VTPRAHAANCEKRLRLNRLFSVLLNLGATIAS